VLDVRSLVFGDFMSYICSQCGYGSVSWMGKCPSCGAWQSFFKKEEEKKITVKELKIISLDKIPKIEKIEKKLVSLRSIVFWGAVLLREKPFF
jgi:predicted ATP-dependent serine protease